MTAEEISKYAFSKKYCNINNVVIYNGIKIVGDFMCKEHEPGFYTKENQWKFVTQTEKGELVLEGNKISKITAVDIVTGVTVY